MLAWLLNIDFAGSGAAAALGGAASIRLKSRDSFVAPRRPGSGLGRVFIKVGQAWKTATAGA